MAGLNKVMLIGNLGKDPEIRYSQQGTAVVKFSIATSEQWTDKNTGNRQDKTEWHNIVVFGKQAEVCEKYLSKGSKVYVEGRLQTSTYEKDGQTRYFTEIVVANFQFLDSKRDAQGGGGQGGGYQQGGGGQQGGGYQNQNSGSDNSNNYQSPSNPGNTGPGNTGGQQPIPDDDIPF